MSGIDVENQRADGLLGTKVPLVSAQVESAADLAVLRAHWATGTPVPVLTASRDEGADHSWAGLDVRTLVRGEDSAGRFAVHSLVLAPGAELPAHYADDVHSYLLVTEGEVELGIGSARDAVGPHSLGYAPPRTHQSLRNASDAPATVMLVHSPAGIDRAFAAAHDRWAVTGSQDVGSYAEVLAPYGFHFSSELFENDVRVNDEAPPLDFDLHVAGDLDRLRELFASRPGVPRLVRTTPAEFDAAAAGETRRKELLNGDASAGTAMFNMLSGVPGMNAPPHHQPSEEEFFFVTGGRLTVTCGSVTRVVGAGALAFIPRYCTHGFANESESEARFVTLNSPAGHERALAMLRRLAARQASKERLVEAAAVGGWILHDEDALMAPRR